MNRIILIGNGFDLAHGFKTSYKDFLEDYLKPKREKIKINVQRHRTNTSLDFKHPNDYYGEEDEDINIASIKILEIRNIDQDKEFLKIMRNHSKGAFFKKIITAYENKKWVDIEDDYYDILKQLYQNKGSIRIDEIGFHFLYDIKDLNKDFDRIKKALFNYLKKINKEHCSLDYIIIMNELYSYFELKDFSEESIKKLEQMGWKSPVTIMPDNKLDKTQIAITKDDWDETQNTKIDLLPKKICFLNFNYTISERFYIDPVYKLNNKFPQSYFENIHIHGTLYHEDSIIFGYGDELDEDYKKIERLNDNEYLKNVKSIRYLDNSNYKKLLRFINSDMYQIFIFGHSCGISDRTLLNTLFEHDNCASIKVFYHEKCEEKDGKKIKIDNFTDLIQNISRNFNDKVKMRDRVVCKEYCEPLISAVDKT